MSEKQKKIYQKVNIKLSLTQSLKKEKLNLGEIFIKGKSSKEIFLNLYFAIHL